MPILTWIGKEKVVNHHLDVPYRVLEHQYTYAGSGVNLTEEQRDGNKIIRGDNLEALKALLPQYEGRIKCVYIDPPTTQAMRAGCITITSMTPKSGHGWAPWWAERART